MLGRARFARAKLPVLLRAAFLSLFFASGAAGLVYQVIWERLLTFSTGADSHSVTVIVAGFMLGLGAGSLAGGHLSDRLGRRQRLLAFAACELGVGGFALASAWLFYDVIYVGLGSYGYSRPTLAVVGFLTLLPPTVLMGMSLPLAGRIMTSDSDRPDAWVPTLYGWNTLGAAAGAVLSVSFLFALTDFTASLIITATINVAAALVALALFAREQNGTRDPDGDAGVVVRAIDSRTWIALYAVSGFVALALEVLWFRILTVVVKSTSVTFGLLLALYLTGVGLGSLMGRSSWTRRLPASRAFLVMQAAIPIISALALALLIELVERPIGAPLRAYLSGYHGRPFHELFTPIVLGVMFGVPVLLMGLPTLLMGLSFALLQRAVQVNVHGLGRRLGWLQTANILGGVVGTLLTGFVLIDSLDTSGSMRLLVVLSIPFLVPAVRGLTTGTAAVRAAIRIGCAVVLALAFLAVPAGELWPRLHGISAGSAIYWEDSTGVALLKPEDNGTTVMFANGLGHSRIPFGGLHTILGALPVLMHPNPRHVAVIGLGSGDTMYALSGRAETESISAVEIIGAEVTVLRQLAAAGGADAVRLLLADPRSRVVIDDGRVFLLRSTARFDVIEADALWPRTAYSGNLYSLEYFELLRARLSSGGYAVSWLPTSRVRDTMIAAFPYVIVIGEIGIGSSSPVAFDAGEIRRRLEQPFTKAHYARAGIDIQAELSGFLTREFDAYDPGFDRTSLVDLNRDLAPRDEFRRR